MARNLLLDEQPLVLLPKLATLVGLNESIILQQLHSHIENDNNANEKNHYKDGYYWDCNTYSDWQLQFPFFSKRTIQRTILNLEKQGLVVSDNYNILEFDNTKWYRIDYVELDLLIGSELAKSTCKDGVKYGY